MALHHVAIDNRISLHSDAFIAPQGSSLALPFSSRTPTIPSGALRFWALKSASLPPKSP